MADQLDVVLFGASGFTGKYVVREFLKFLTRPDGQPRRIALAGRSRSNLAAALAWAAAPNPAPALPFIEANVDDTDSLRAMCGRTKLVVSCVGPYRLYGEPVVAACVEAGADYLDITGEPEFMEKMEEKYHEGAREKGALVVSACGYDSIPAEIGLLHHLKQWEEPSVPNAVNCFLELRSSKKMVGNVGTWESLVLGVGSASELRKMRQRKKAASQGGVRVRVPGATAQKPSLLSWCKELKLWTVLLPSADAAVVRRTMTAIAMGGPASIEEEDDQGLPSMAQSRKLLFKPVHFGVFSATPSLLSILGQMWMALSIITLAQFAFGRRLLLRYPGFFSLGLFRRSGPSESQVDAASFNLWFIGKGYSDANLISSSSSSSKMDMQIMTRVSGPEIGYITTPICLVQCALLVLDRRSCLPRGGVLTPGVVFGSTDLEHRLQANGISFDFISRGSIQKNH